MSYATLIELKAVIPARDLALLSDHSDGTVMDDARLQAALDDATAEIDGQIARRVAQPVSPVPRMLSVICRDLAVWRLYANVGRVTETQSELRRAGLDWLELVRKGDIAIGDETPGATVSTSPGVAMTEGPERTLTRDSLRGF